MIDSLQHFLCKLCNIIVNVSHNSCDVVFVYFLKVKYDAEFLVSRFGIMAQNVEAAPNVIQEAMAACSNLLSSVIKHIIAVHIML
jgi:hypothetical protein